MSEINPSASAARLPRVGDFPKISKIELGEVIHETRKAAAKVEAVRLGAATAAEDEHAEALVAERHEVAPSRSPG